MIRLREEQYPPPYQLDLTLRILRNGDNDLALRILKASPLYDTKTIEVTHVNNYVETYERVDSVHPIQVPTDTDMSVKVEYIDALVEYQTYEDILWSSSTFGIYRYHIDDMYTDEPHTYLDYAEKDKRYHKFTHITNLHIFSVDDTYMVLWYNLEDATDYIACVPKLIAETGSKVRR